MRPLLLLVVSACGVSHRGERAPVAWEPPIVIAAGGGTRGAWHQNDSRYDYVDDPSVTLAPDGAAEVVWVDHRRKDVLFQIYDPDGQPRFAAPVNVSRSPAVFSWLPRIALSPRLPAHVYVLWQEIVFSGGTHGGDIFFARSRDGGAHFDAPVNLSRSVAGDGKGRIDAKRWHNGSLDLAVGADGTIAAAWTAYEGPLWFRRSRDGGDTFEDAVVVDAGTRAPARAPALALADDVIALAWTTGEDPHADVRIAISRDGHSFSAPVLVARTPAYSDAPDVAIDHVGTLHVVYAEAVGGPFGRPHVQYTRSRDGTAFDAARTLAAGAGSPAIAADAGALVVLWEHYPESSEAPHGLGVAVSRDGGATFTQPVVVPGSIDPGANGSREGRLVRKLAVRGAAIAAVNSALGPGAGSRVWLVRGALQPVAR